MIISTLSKILDDTKADQIRLLESLIAEFASSHYVQEIYIRGSIASGKFDRASDIDLIVIVDEHHFIEYLSVLDDLMRIRFSSILPGWYDSIVPNFGGVGLVYLVSSPDDLIYQIDIYVATRNTKNFTSIQAGEIRLLYFVDEHLSVGVTKARFTVKHAAKISRFVKTRSSALSDFTEVAVLCIMLLKRVQRATFFLNCDNTGMLYKAVQKLIRRKYAPQFREYGWYKFDAVLVTPESERFVLSLKAIMEKGAFSTYQSIEETFKLAVEIFRHCFEEEFQSVRVAIAFLLTTIEGFARGLK